MLWAMIDGVVCCYLSLNAVYYLVESTLLMTLDVVLGAVIFIGNRYGTSWTLLMNDFLTKCNSWSPLGAAPTVPGIFLVVNSLLYVVQTCPKTQ
jgi:hypothetical protein